MKDTPARMAFNSEGVWHRVRDRLRGRNWAKTFYRGRGPSTAVAQYSLYTDYSVFRSDIRHPMARDDERSGGHGTARTPRVSHSLCVECRLVSVSHAMCRSCASLFFDELTFMGLHKAPGLHFYWTSNF